MKLTEEEASTTLCVQSLNNFYRLNVTEPATRPTCVASDCMAWRWCNGEEHIHEQIGYCGLAGKPEDEPA